MLRNIDAAQVRRLGLLERMDDGALLREDGTGHQMETEPEEDLGKDGRMQYRRR